MCNGVAEIGDLQQISNSGVARELKALAVKIIGEAIAIIGERQ